MHVNDALRSLPLLHISRAKCCFGAFAYEHETNKWLSERRSRCVKNDTDKYIKRTLSMGMETQVDTQQREEATWTRNIDVFAHQRRSAQARVKKAHSGVRRTHATRLLRRSMCTPGIGALLLRIPPVETSCACAFEWSLS